MPTEKYACDIRPGELVNNDGEWQTVAHNHRNSFAPGGILTFDDGSFLHYDRITEVYNVRRAEFVRPAGF